MVAPVPAEISKPCPRLRTPPRRRVLTYYPPLTAHSFLRLQALNSFASYHIPATPAVSCDYALFCATARRDPSYFQWLPHSFYHHGGVPSATSVLLTPCPLCCAFSQSSGAQARQLFCLHRPGASLSSLYALFYPRFLCFQSLAASFCKTPGVGGYPDPDSCTLGRGRRGLPVPEMQLSRLRIRRRR
jgi:hypothetical protein